MVTDVIQTLCETKDWSHTEESALIILKLIRSMVILVCTEKRVKVAAIIFYLFLLGGFQVVKADHSEGWNNLHVLLNGMSKILAKSGTRTTVEIVQCYGFFTNVCVSFVNLLLE